MFEEIFNQNTIINAPEDDDLGDLAVDDADSTEEDSEDEDLSDEEDLESDGGDE